MRCGMSYTQFGPCPCRMFPLIARIPLARGHGSRPIGRALQGEGRDTCRWDDRAADGSYRDAAERPAQWASCANHVDHAIGMSCSMSAFLLLAAAPAALAASPANPSQAQDTTDNSTIIVTGKALSDLPTATAYDVTTIDRTRLAQVSSGRLEDALGDVAGLSLFRRSDSRSANPSANGFTLRGLGGTATSRTLVLLDGVPQADPFFGAVPLTALNPGDIGNIRVIHGGGHRHVWRWCGCRNDRHGQRRPRPARTGRRHGTGG